MRVTGISDHALQRFADRTNSKLSGNAAGMEKLARRLMRKAEQALPMGNNEFYKDGKIFVIVDGFIRTIYPPRTPAQLAAVHAVSTNKLKCHTSN